MRIRTWLALAPLALGLAGTPALAKDWLLVGGAGQYGDCMMEWRMQFPDGFIPRGHRRDTDKLSSKQTCVDGDSDCDLDGSVNNSCRFRVGMCFCVDDSLTTCDVRRDMFCGDPITGGIGEIRYGFSRPRKTSTKPMEAENASRLFDALSDSGLADDTANPVVYDATLRKPLQAPGESCVVDNPPNFPAACQPCTDYADLDVPLKLRFDASYRKNSLRIRGRFSPLTVDPGGDKLVLICQPIPSTTSTTSTTETTTSTTESTTSTTESTTSTTESTTSTTESTTSTTVAAHAGWGVLGPTG